MSLQLDPAPNPHRYRIDSFEVPAAARPDFEVAMNRNLAFLKEQPGFLGHSVFEQVAGPTTFNVVTIAGWEDQAAADQAGGKVRAYYQSIGFDMPAFVARLGIKASIGNYETMRPRP